MESTTDIMFEGESLKRIEKEWLEDDMKINHGSV